MTVAQRIAAEIEAAPPKRRAVLEAGLLRLVVHRRQRLDDGRLYLELCPSYLATMVGCAYETARQAWQVLERAIGWREVLRETVTRLGGQVRRLVRGKRHGRHLVLTPGKVDTLRRVAARLGILRDTPDDRLDWRAVEPQRRGRSLVCCCPHHDDTDPSMVLDPRRRRATCFVCQRSWRYDHALQRVSTGQAAPVTRRTGTNRYPRPLSTNAWVAPPVSGWHVGVLHGAGVRVVPVKGDLLQALARSERRAARARVPALAGCLERPQVPDLLVHADQTVVDDWRRWRGRWLPRLRPVAERYVVVDVDAIEHPNVLDAGTGECLAAAGRQLEAWAIEHPALSGRVAVVQTSLHGVQATLELAQARPPGWRRTTEGARVCDAVDAQVLEVLDAAGYLGGTPDPTARDSGRLIRRPGPRLDKRDQPWVARARYISPEAPCPA